MPSSQSTIQLLSLTGEEIHDFIPELARLRILVFREYPYLYEGSLGYEETYLKRLADCKESIMVIAFNGERVIGASTGLPLTDETPNVQKPWTDAGENIGRMFYFGESVLEKQYRGQGIGKAFFEYREAWVKKLGRFDSIVFCGVVRPEDHPFKPADYLPLDGFWRTRGFAKTTNKQCVMIWQDIDEDKEREKHLHFWEKKLTVSPPHSGRQATR